jgi:hypothetical protein
MNNYEILKSLKKLNRLRVETISGVKKNSDSEFNPEVNVILKKNICIRHLQELINPGLTNV